MLNELAIDVEGEPFEVPTSVTKWRVRRVEGRGRPGLVYARAIAGQQAQPGQPVQGAPLLLEVGATYADLAKKAGPGRYRLDPVDAEGRKVEGVPVAVTGPLEALDDTASEPGASDEDLSPTPGAGGLAVRRGTRTEELLAVTVEANTRIVEKAIGQLGTLMSGMAELLGAAHGAGITNRVPLLLPAPPAAEIIETTYEEQAKPAGMPEWLTLLIQQAVQTIIPAVMTKIPGLSSIPLAAMVDWSKAVPANDAARSSAPAAPAVQPAASPTTPPYVGTSPAEPPRAAPSDVRTGEAVPAPAGGVVGSSRSAANDSIPLATHVTHIWQSLSIPEQARASQLIALLTHEERTAWVAELGRLSMPEAIARIRAVIERQTPAPMPQLERGPAADKSVAPT